MMVSIVLFALPQLVSAYTISNAQYSVTTGTNGEITDLTIVGDQYSTNYVMNGTNAKNQNTTEHQWVGELMFTYRLGTGAWNEAWSSKSADGRTQSQTGNKVDITYQNSTNAKGIKNFRVNESYELVGDYVKWSIQVTNTSTQTLEIGDFGLPLPLNEYWSAGGNEQIYEKRVVTHSNVANHNSYITAQRPSGSGNTLMLVPDTSTGAGFEYMDNWRIEEHPGSTWAADQGGWPEGLTVYYIHSNVIKSTNRGYLPNSSLVLAPNASKTYSFKFVKAANEQAIKNRLYTEGMIDVTVVPSMIIPTNQTGKFSLRTTKTINSITAQYPSETTITAIENKADGNKIYSIKMNHLGQNDITVSYGNGEKTVLQFYAIEPIDTALQRHATFMVEKTQWNSPGNIKDKVFDDWLMSTKAKRNIFNGYWGWGDDWGYTHAQFLAEKNVQKPVATEVTAVDEYLQTAIWTNLMNGHQTDYLIHDFLMPEPNTTPTYRGYAYPHIYNTYFSMYKISKLYPDLISYKNTRTTYLLRAYNIFKTLYDGPVSYNWNTGLMGEQTTPEIIKALQDEGLTTQANDMIAKMNTKYANFSGTTYPYGSEYNYDNTGEESVYMLAKMKNNTTMMGKINAKTRATRGQMPLWYLYSVPVTITGEPWWNFQYSVSLVGYAMDDWVRNYSANPEVDQRLTYAAKIGNISAINSGQISNDPANIGSVAWTYQMGKGNQGALGLGGGPLFNGWRGMAGEADLGLFGAIRILSSDVSVDPIFGLYCYGCDVVDQSTAYKVILKDGVQQKVNLITEKLAVSVDRNTITEANLSKDKKDVQLTIANATPSKSHSMKINLSGLPSGNYNITVNNAAAGSVNVVSGAATTVTVAMSTAASQSVRIAYGATVVIPEIIAKYEMNHSSGTIVSDTSGNGKNGTTSGTVSWDTGKNGNALSLSGTNSYAQLPTGIMSGTTDFTIATWVKVNANSDWARIFDFGQDTSKYMMLTADAGGTTGLRFAITNSGNGNEQQINTNTTLATNTWKHVAITKSGSTGIMYIDGVEVARNNSMTITPNDLGATTKNYIGKSQFSDPYLNGSIDDFIIYSRGLAATEIQALYGSGAVTPAVDVALLATASTSYVSSWESLTGLNDGYTPTSSSDRNHPVYGNWDNPNTTQWVQYDFDKSRTIERTELYWFSDGLGIAVPASYQFQYWNGSAWVNFSNVVGLGTAVNQYNVTTFTPVTTTKIRVNITAKTTTSTGVESWKVIGQ